MVGLFIWPCSILFCHFQTDLIFNSKLGNFSATMIYWSGHVDGLNETFCLIKVTLSVEAIGWSENVWCLTVISPSVSLSVGEGNVRQHLAALIACCVWSPMLWLINVVVSSALEACMLDTHRFGALSGPYPPPREPTGSCTFLPSWGWTSHTSNWTKSCLLQMIAALVLFCLCSICDHHSRVTNYFVQFGYNLSAVHFE